MQLKILEPVGCGPTRLYCATLIEPIRPRICECRFLGSPKHAFKYMCMQLISYNMRSRNTRNAINNSYVTPCCALQKLNHLVSHMLIETQTKQTPTRCNNSFVNLKSHAFKYDHGYASMRYD